uniref:Secreted protein n=1 Tax=Knipowitschia caucasica TaxID=637954 RepID=A0AAV2LV78_KNICA
MALALLSPFICSEWALAPVLVCLWPCLHLACLPLLSSPDSWLPPALVPEEQTDDKSLGSTKACSPSVNRTTLPPLSSLAPHTMIPCLLLVLQSVSGHWRST